MSIHPYDMSIDELLDTNIFEHISHLSLRQIRKTNIERLLDQLSSERDDVVRAETIADILVSISELETDESA